MPTDGPRHKLTCTARDTLNRLDCRCGYAGFEIRKRLQEIQRLSEMHSEQIVLLLGEENELHRELQAIEKPVIKVTKGRCRICKEQTSEKFGERFQCYRHVAGGNTQQIAVLEDLIYGPKQS